MDEKLKEEMLSFFINVDRTMKAYLYALTSRQYIDPDSHIKNIEKINMLSKELKKKVESL
jgi:hypothetical protein